MSLVGPRPERPELQKEIEKEVPEFGLRLQAKAGLTGYTRKHGLEEANGSWIAILDSDDAWAPEKLENSIMMSLEKW